MDQATAARVAASIRQTGEMVAKAEADYAHHMGVARTAKDKGLAAAHFSMAERAYHYATLGRDAIDRYFDQVR